MDIESTITNGLRVAAEKFDANAEAMRDVNPRLSAQFRTQAHEARELASMIDERGLPELVRSFPDLER